MTERRSKPSRLREAALRDIEEVTDYYLNEAPHMLAKLEMAILVACGHVEKFPGTGSKRYLAGNTEEPLRFWTLNKFPYAIFYFERSHYIDIIRMLHQAANIPVHLSA